VCFTLSNIKKRSSLKFFFDVVKLSYSQYSWNNFEFLTAQELFKSDPELFINLYHTIKINYLRSRSETPAYIFNDDKRRQHFKTLYNLMYKLEPEISMINDAEKYNL